MDVNTLNDAYTVCWNHSFGDAAAAGDVESSSSLLLNYPADISNSDVVILSVRRVKVQGVSKRGFASPEELFDYHCNSELR